MVEEHRARARDLARRAIAHGEPTGWFEPLYAAAAGDPAAIQWADLTANPHLLGWLRERRAGGGGGRRALVVGCGLGDDAEALARAGYAVVGFDVAPTAVAWSRRRFADSAVDYVVADLLEPPVAWGRAFDLVVEIYTLQVLPPEPRRRAVGRLAAFVAPGGTLLVVARGRDEGDDHGAMPWPLTRSDLAGFAAEGLIEVAVDDFLDRERLRVRRFRAEYRRPEEGVLEVGAPVALR